MWANLRFNDDFRSCAPCTAAKLITHLGRDIAIGRGMRSVRRSGDHRQSGIRLFADVHMQWHLAEKRHAEACRFVARAAMAENVGTFPALRAQEIAHVLDN